jgi:hypothetical protein
MEYYSDKILFHATGHDHMADIRYSTTDPTTKQKGDKNYLNKVIFPSVTAASFTNPTYSTFKYDTESSSFSDLVFTSLKITQSIGVNAPLNYHVT